MHDRVVEVDITVPPTVAVRHLRELALAADWRWERFEDTRLVERFAIIMPMASAARVLGLRILSGPCTGLELAAWTHTPGSGGVVHTIRLARPPSVRRADFTHLLRAWVAALPRCPWRWSFGERLRLGLAIPRYRTARGIYRKQGFDTSRRGWPFEAPEWPPESTTEAEE